MTYLGRITQLRKTRNGQHGWIVTDDRLRFHFHIADCAPGYLPRERDAVNFEGHKMRKMGMTDKAINVRPARSEAVAA